MLLKWMLRLATILLCLPLLTLSQQALAESPVNKNMLNNPSGPIVLEISGKLNNPNRDGLAVFDMDMLKSLPTHSIDTSTVVTDGVHNFQGVLVRDLLSIIQAHGKNLKAIALNDYFVNISTDDFYNYDVIIAYEMDGQELKPSDKGPLWIIYPRDDYKELQDIRYDYKWVWQLYKIEMN